MNNAEDILKKILLNMRYDASKTLKENREIIFEDSNKSWVDVNNNPISFNGKVLKTAKTQLKDFKTDYNVTGNKIAKDIRIGCFRSIGSSHFENTGTAGWGYDWISESSKNSKFKRKGDARRQPTLEYKRWDDDRTNLNKIGDHTVVGSYQSIVPGFTQNKDGTPFYNAALHDDYTKVINTCIKNSITYLYKELPQNMPGKIKSNDKIYSTSIYCSYGTCFDSSFRKSYSVGYYDGNNEKLDIDQIQQLPQVNVFANKNPTINTKTIGNEDKTTTYSSDKLFDYKKEGDRYYFKGKDSTEMAIKYPTWKQAEGSGLESIKKKIVFTGIEDGSEKGLDIIGDDGIIDVDMDQNNENGFLGDEISLYLSGGGN